MRGLQKSLTLQITLFLFHSLAGQLEQLAAVPEETEQLVVKKIPFREAWQMVEKGLITGAMLVASIQKVKLMLG